MATNEYQNCLKFSKNDNSCNKLTGILNQNPIIITKKEAYNFNYTDVNKLRLAQLLAKRDIAAIKETESNKIHEELVQKSIEAENSSKLKTVNDKTNTKLCRQSIKTKQLREHVSSIKRVPGPQTPNKITVKRTMPVKNILKNMPVRSDSPPTRDTDYIWTPKKDNDVFVTKETEMEKLCKKVELCTNKLDELEKQLIIKSKIIDHNINLNPQRDSNRPIKSHKKFGVLSDKLQLLINSNQNVNDKSYNIPVPVETLQPPEKDNINFVLSRLDNLVSEIDIIQSRWSQLNYETISVYSDDQQCLDKEMRFTKNQREEDIIIDEMESDLLDLDIPRNLVVKLDNNRKNPIDLFKFNGIPIKLTHIDWLADDFVDELIEAVVDEIDDTNNHLVETILQEELHA